MKDQELGELDILDFTSINGDKVFYDLKSELKRDPTQYEFDNRIDFEYEKYLKRIYNLE